MAQTNLNPVFLGRLTFQSENTYGGAQYVFVKLMGAQKNSYRPTNGGVIQNPPRNGGHMFQGDLCEYRIDDKIFLYRTFVASAVAAADAVSIVLKKDEYKHVPEIGMVLMKAPSTLNGTGAAATITAIAETDTTWTLTLSAAIGALAVNDILVEAVEAGADKEALVKNPNSMLDIDAFFKMPTVATANGKDIGKYAIAPVMHQIAYTSRMQPLPASVLAINRSRVAGWFEL